MTLPFSYYILFTINFQLFALTVWTRRNLSSDQTATLTHLSDETLREIKILISKSKDNEDNLGYFFIFINEIEIK